MIEISFDRSLVSRVFVGYGNSLEITWCSSEMFREIAASKLTVPEIKRSPLNRFTGLIILEFGYQIFNSG